MNTANQNSQGTRPRVAGQLSDIIEEYREAHPEGGFDEWQEFYFDEYDGDKRIEEATEKVYEMVVKMQEAAKEIDEEMVHRWVTDLVLYKTYTGLGRNQEAIFKKLATEYGMDYRQSTAAEESRGIDGHLGDQPVSIKPITYQQKSRLQEDIAAPIVYYEEYKTSKALKLHVEELDAVLNG